MAPNSEVTPTSIITIRENDPQAQGEAIQEKQSFNDKRMLEFMRGKVAAENFDTQFTLDLAIKIASQGSTATEKMISARLSEVKGILSKYNKEDIFNEKDKAVVSGILENVKTPPTSMSLRDAEKILSAWEYFSTIREHCGRLLKAEDVLSNSRKAEYSASQSMADGVQEKLGDARRNWDTWSTGQKLAVAGVALVGAVLFLKSDNKYVGKIKDVLKYGVMIAGGGWLVSKAYYLFTGESLVDKVTGTGKSGGQSKFIKESFRTDDKGAEVLTKAMVHMGDYSFMDLLDKYEKSKDQTIGGAGMPANEAYQAMGVVIKRFGIDHLKTTYAKYKPPIKFSQVIAMEMANDPKIDLADGVASRAYEGLGDYLQRGYHYLAATAPSVWLANKYESWFGKKASQEELQKFAERFGKIAKTEKELPEVIQKQLISNDKRVAKNYVKVVESGKSAPRFGLKYDESSDGYVYMIVERTMNNVTGDEKALDANVQACIEQAEEFVVEQYKVDKSRASKKMEPHGSVFVIENASLRYCVRFKKK